MNKVLGYMQVPDTVFFYNSGDYSWCHGHGHPCLVPMLTHIKTWLPHDKENDILVPQLRYMPNELYTFPWDKKSAVGEARRRAQGGGGCGLQGRRAVRVRVRRPLRRAAACALAAFFRGTPYCDDHGFKACSRVYLAYRCRFHETESPVQVGGWRAADGHAAPARRQPCSVRGPVALGCGARGRAPGPPPLPPWPPAGLTLDYATIEPQLHTDPEVMEHGLYKKVGRSSCPASRA
jgi:hypothetical protein